MPSERELTQMLSVSRTTLREALHGLAVMGAVEVRHGQGIFVARSKTGTEQLQELGAALAKGVTGDLLEVRRILLIEAARLAAERRTEEDLEAIDASLRAYAKAVRVHRAPAHEGLGFDMAVSAAAHNEVLSGVLRSFSRSILPAARHVYDRTEGFWEQDLHEHEDICEAIRARDASLSAERMRVHVRDVGEVYRLAGEI
jgi:GntR family transcriptional repressor for pyruvate dehydrogenase complex